jgi:cullin-associated NEDD8-dissociated protein 1
MMDSNFVFNSDQEDYSDDDDVSWKIRRAAAKCLEAIISTRHDLVQLFYSDVSPVLISRFKGILTFFTVFYPSYQMFFLCVSRT